MNNREIAGVKVFVSGETYDEYKGTLQEQIENLQSKIDKAIEFCDYSFKNPWYISEKELLGKIIDILKEEK